MWYSVISDSHYMDNTSNHFHLDRLDDNGYNNHLKMSEAFLVNDSYRNYIH